MKAILRLAPPLLLLSACASKSPKSDEPQKPAPTYTEKSGAVSVEDLKASATCPAGGWEQSEWRKLVAQTAACVKAKDWSKVEKMGNHLAITASQTPWGAYYLSLAAASRKDYPRATWMLELAMKKTPNEGIFQYQLGRLHWEQGEDALALKELKLASDLNPALTDAHHVMGALALQKQDYSGAEKLFGKALANDSNHFPSVMGMAAVKMASKDWAAAEDILDKAVRLNPRSSKARLALAQVQEQHLKKLSDALQTYKDLKQMMSDRKLDETIPMNVEEKIKTLEKSLSQAGQPPKVSARQPTAERQVKK